jgi:hypothetical protein
MYMTVSVTKREHHKHRATYRIATYCEEPTLALRVLAVRRDLWRSFEQHFDFGPSMQLVA